MFLKRKTQEECRVNPKIGSALKVSVENDTGGNRSKLSNWINKFKQETFICFLFGFFFLVGITTN